MQEIFARTAMLLGEVALTKLEKSRVAIFGVGGVGGYTAEALARSGVGSLHLFDNDRICPSNINRQIIALHSSLGEYKVDAMRARILDINPHADVAANRLFYMPDSADTVDLAAYDYVVDAVDTVTAKLELVCRATALGIPIISSMGAANKMDPTAFQVADIYTTSVCPLARVMRSELRKRGIPGLKVVYSKEPPLRPQPLAHSVAEVPPCDATAQSKADAPVANGSAAPRRQVPASNAFVPPVAGLIVASEVIKDLIGYSGTSLPPGG